MLLASTFRGVTVLDSIDSTLYPSHFDLVFRALWCYIPEPLLHYVRYFPFREYRRFRTFLDFSNSYSRSIISESKDKSDGKDMISVLLRANASEDSTDKMTDSEVVSQITCVITILLEMIQVVCMLTPSPYTVHCSLQGMRPPQTP